MAFRAERLGKNGRWLVVMRDGRTAKIIINSQLLMECAVKVIHSQFPVFSCVLERPFGFLSSKMLRPTGCGWMLRDGGGERPLVDCDGDGKTAVLIF